jgi:hypothetical protein
MTRPGMTRPGLPTRPNPRVGDARRLAFPALPKLETRHSIVDQHRELVLRNMPASTALPVTLSSVARQSKPLVQRQSAIHPMVEQRSVGKLVSSPKPPEAGAQRARLYISLTAGHHNSRMQLMLDDIHRRQ